MTREDIRAVVEQFASIGAIITSADPADKAEIYWPLNLSLTYQPAAKTAVAEADLGEINHGLWVVSEVRLTQIPMHRDRAPSRTR